MSETTVKERPILFSVPMVRAILSGRKTQTRRICKPQPRSVGDSWEPVPCHYGRPGDRLWVREAFHWDGVGTDVSYRADFTDKDAKEAFTHVGEKWRPSIHMPRWASRITLEVTGVRVERLNDISEQDAIAEGFQCAGVPASLTNRGEFAKLWDSINGDGSWSENPWVWVIEFRRLEQQQ